jgi:hypothetical protein
MKDPISLQTILQLVDSFGLVSILVLLLVLFYQGRIMSRKVWEELTTKVVDGLSARYEQMTTEMVKEIVDSVVRCLEDVVGGRK